MVSIHWYGGVFLEQKKEFGAVLRMAARAVLLWVITALVLLLVCSLTLSVSDVKSSSYSAFSLAIAFAAALFAGRGAAAEGRIGVGYALLFGILLGSLLALIGWIADGEGFSVQQAAGVFILTVLGMLLGTRFVSRHPAAKAFRSSRHRKHSMS